MPHSTTSASEISTQRWRTALTNAQKRRLEADQLGKPLRKLALEHRVSADTVADIVVSLQPARGQSYDKDPLVLRYVARLLKLKLTGASNVLLALLRHSRFSKPDAPPPIISVGLATFEERVFVLLRERLANADFSAATWKAHGIVFALARWLHAVNQYEMAQQLELGALHTVAYSTTTMYEALGMLVYNVFSHRSFRDVDGHPWWKTRRSLIVAEMESFDMNVLQWTRSRITGHLQALTKARPFLEIDDKGMPIITHGMVLAIHSDLPTVNSRAGLFVWLSASLYARPLTDDATMRNYLMVRYQDDAQTAAVDLVLASFDVLTNCILNNGTPHSQKNVRSFICNKLPLLLTSLSTFTGSAAVETCISMALVSVNLEPLAPLGAGAAEVRDALKKTRVEFLQTCMLHSLVTESTVSTIIQDQPVSQLKVARYNKAALLSQCSNNTSRLEVLLQELDAMHGNAGAIAGCVVDTVNNLCSIKDTMTLKTVCSLLLRRVQAFDIILQYSQPSSLLLPLCNLLNVWVHDQDQTEFQPPYEEFAVILLLSLAIIHLYDLKLSDIGLPNDDNFMMKLQRGSSQSLPLSELTEEQNKQISNWTEGLYATDEHGDTIGITDEVYSQCPPQAFYLLVPTLFEQTVLGCKSKALSLNTAKGGLEFLLEPFLLPSLIGGISWLIEHSWQEHEDTDIHLQILDKLLRPSSSFQEIQVMHKAILAIVAVPLEKSLRDLIRRSPEKTKEASSLIELLKPHLAQQRTDCCSKGELEVWTALDAGSLAFHLRNSIRELTVWASSGASSVPPKHTPCIFWAVEQVLGVEASLDILAEEVRDQTSSGSGPIAFDVCTAMVCAPEQDSYAPLMLPSQAGRLSLRDCLSLTLADTKKLLALPFDKAEALIRLSRKVEAQSAVSQMAMVSLSMPTQDATDQVMQDLGLSGAGSSLDAAAAMGQAAGAGFDDSAFAAASDHALGLANPTSEDLNNIVSDSNLMSIDQSQDLFGDFNMDLTGQSSQLENLGGVNDDSGDGTSGQQNADDDIFAELDMRNLGEDFSFS